MAARIVQIADALVANLQEKQFSLPFVCERQYFPVRELKDYGVLRVTVIPVTWERSGGSRGDDEVDHTIEIDIQQQLSGPKQLEGPEGDALMALVEEIANFLSPLELSELAAPAVTAVTAATLLDRTHWQQHRLFTAALRVTVTDFVALPGD